MYQKKFQMFQICIIGYIFALTIARAKWYSFWSATDETELWNIGTVFGVELQMD